MESANHAMPVWHRLWRYQAERFPLVAHGFVVLVFSAALGASAAALGGQTLEIWRLLAGAVCVFLVFLVLRVLDEFKDAEVDRLYRPERPVPRGLVSLRLLAVVGAVAVAASLLLAGGLLPASLPALIAVWLWAGLMAVEFFAPAALRKRPLLYLVSHMLIMPGLAIFLAMAADVRFPPHLLLALASLLVIAFASGTVLEVGRKLWATVNERVGVETYSSTFGVPRATGLWASAGLMLTGGVVWALLSAHQPELALSAVGIFPLAIVFVSARYVRRPDAAAQKIVNGASGLLVLAACTLLIAAAALNGVFA